MNKAIKILFPFTIVCILFILGTCKTQDKNIGKSSNVDTAAVVLNFFQNQTIRDPRIIKCINDYMIYVQMHCHEPVVYQMIVEKYDQDTAKFILTVEEEKNCLLKHQPIGYFWHKCEKFYIYSSLSEFCEKDSTIVEWLRADNTKFENRSEEDQCLQPTRIYLVCRDTIIVESSLDVFQSPFSKVQQLKPIRLISKRTSRKIDSDSVCSQIRKSGKLNK